MRGLGVLPLSECKQAYRTGLIRQYFSCDNEEESKIISLWVCVGLRELGKVNGRSSHEDECSSEVRDVENHKFVSYYADYFSETTRN